MATRNGPITVDTKTVTLAATPEALTADDISCTSVYVIAATTNVGANIYVTDNTDTSKKIRVPTGGLTLPMGKPKLITVAVDTDGDKVDWMAV